MNLKLTSLIILACTLIMTGCTKTTSEYNPLLALLGGGPTWERFVNSSGQIEDRFGESLAISADGRTIVVGEQQGAGESHENQGAVYVYTLSGSTWSLAAKLTASDGISPFAFGRSVAVSSDGSVVAVGSPTKSPSSCGAVYVFERPVGGWADATQTAYLTMTDAANGYYLGISLAISGDGSVIAAGADQYYASSGAVYMYVRSGSNWTDNAEDAKLTQSDSAATTTRFGMTLGMSADGSTVVVGTNNLKTIYVFNKPGTGWADSSTPDAKLTASDSAANNMFGSVVAVSADGSTIAAKAVRPDDAGGGSVYLYVKPGTGWADTTENTQVQADEPYDKDYFGYSVALNADGSSFMAGSYIEDKVYVFDRPSGGWSGSIDSVLILEPESEDAGDLYFGYSLAINGNCLLVGAPGENCPLIDQGSFYIFSR